MSEDTTVSTSTVQTLPTITNESTEYNATEQPTENTPQAPALAGADPEKEKQFQRYVQAERKLSKQRREFESRVAEFERKQAEFDAKQKDWSKREDEWKL